LNALVGLVGGSDVAGKAPLDMSARLQSSAPANVLLVEDNPVNRKLAVSLLEKWGHYVVIAEDGQQALDILECQRFELVLMDIQMPVMGGFEATARIRERERQTGQHIPILAMTANAMSGDRERCLQAGMDGYVSKPIKISELFKAIEQALAGGGSISEASRPPPLTLQAGFDYPTALASADQEVVGIIGDIMQEDCPRLLENLFRGADSGDHELLKRSAHTLKGLLGNFGESPALDMAEKANMLAVTGRYGDIPALFADMEAEIARFLDALARHLHPDRIPPARKT
ncbi:MAG: response regulator, partial [Sulfuricella sp.]|nr:response regulator [Sulfuricella sp.]